MISDFIQHFFNTKSIVEKTEKCSCFEMTNICEDAISRFDKSFGRPIYQYKNFAKKKCVNS